KCHWSLQAPGPVRGAERNGLAIHLRRDESRPAVAHLMSNLRHRVVVWRNLSVRRPPCKLASVEGKIVVIGIGYAFSRILVHLVRAGIDRLDELPLESSRAAIALQPSLGRYNPGYRAARWAATQRASTGSARFLVFHAEVGVVRQEIEFIAQGLDDCACQVPRIGQSKVME